MNLTCCGRRRNLCSYRTPQEITAEAGAKAGEIASTMTGQFLSELATGAAATAFVNPALITVYESDGNGGVTQVPVLLRTT